MQSNNKNILRAYKGENTKSLGRSPWWLMRQAGRYLPEYRELRKTAGGFLDMVYNPEFASEVTLQPIRRYGMDGAILFSDILVIPQALGQKLWFETGEGPKLEQNFDFEKLDLSKIDDTLSPVYETVSKVRQKLKEEGFDHTVLIGFCGGPWTVACYMVQGGSSRDGFEKVKNFAGAKPDVFQKVLDVVTDASIHYLSRQIEAGCEAVQLFESWAGLVEGNEFEKFVIRPNQKIARAVKEKYPDIPVIGFPRAAVPEDLKSYAKEIDVNAVGLDYDVPLETALDIQKTGKCIQGNLNPDLLLAGGEGMKNQVREILQSLSTGPFVFNLGHGVIKETPPEHVAELANLIKSYRS